MTRPLIPLALPGRTALPGVWRATIARLNPLGVVVPRLAGGGEVTDCESAVFTTALALGDRVWVAAIEGDPAQLMVLARRR